MSSKIYRYELLRSLDRFHEVCERNNLRYSLIGGTLLGAVRHKGFIPWDDDIDVVMPRNDYERLLDKSSLFSEPFELRSRKTEDCFVYPYAKLANFDVVVEEEFYKPFRNGINMDIFPMDFTFSSGLLQAVHFKLARYSRLALISKFGAFSCKNKNLVGRIARKLLYIIFHLVPKRLIDVGLAFSEKSIALLSQKTYMANLHGAWGRKEATDLRFFCDMKLYEFENRQYWGPRDAHAWLQRVYGDYMVLPAKADRVSHHNIKVVEKGSASDFER
jgi:lipopolysaccharide cholinephosphotransferase